MRFNIIPEIGALPETGEGTYKFVVHQDDRKFQAVRIDISTGAFTWSGEKRGHATEAIGDAWVHATKATMGMTGNDNHTIM